MTIGMTMTKSTRASAEPCPNSPRLKACVYISFATTEVSKLPPVMARTMSNTFSVAIEMVVTTTTSVPRIPGTVTFQNCCQGLAPSSLDASMISTGTPLIAAESSTMAKPV